MAPVTLAEVFRPGTPRSSRCTRAAHARSRSPRSRPRPDHVRRPDAASASGCAASRSRRRPRRSAPGSRVAGLTCRADLWGARRASGREGRWHAVELDALGRLIGRCKRRVLEHTEVPAGDPGVASPARWREEPGGDHRPRHAVQRQPEQEPLGPGRRATRTGRATRRGPSPCRPSDRWAPMRLAACRLSGSRSPSGRSDPRPPVAATAAIAAPISLPWVATESCASGMRSRSAVRNRPTNAPYSGTRSIGIASTSTLIPSTPSVWTSPTSSSIQRSCAFGSS